MRPHRRWTPPVAMRCHCGAAPTPVELVLIRADGGAEASATCGACGSPGTGDLPPEMALRLIAGPLAVPASPC